MSPSATTSPDSAAATATTNPSRRPDGRRARGERARQALIDATLAIIERDGVAGVTHRAVTREAGLTATAAAYHFATINDLLEASLVDADARAAAALSRCQQASDPVRALAGWLVEVFDRERPRCIAEYELYLYAARVPSMRGAAARWLTDLRAMAHTWTPEPRAVAVICAYVDGLMLQALAAGQTPDADDVEATLRHLIAPEARRHP